MNRSRLLQVKANSTSQSRLKINQLQINALARDLVLVLEDGIDGICQAIVGEELCFQVAREWERCVQAGYTRYWGIEVVPTLRLNFCGNFRTNAARHRVFMQNQRTIGLAHAFHNAGLIPRQKRPQINDFDGMLRRVLSRFFCPLYAQAVGDNREVIARNVTLAFPNSRV